MKAIVYISSHDRYHNAWPPLCHSLRKYWPDRPWPLRFVTNRLNPPCGKAIKVGDDTNWSNMQRKALEQIEEEIIFFLIEDCWLTHRVDTKAIVEFAQLIDRGCADRILLCSGSHKSKGTFSLDPRLNVFANRSPYRTALQAGLWRRSVFLELLRSGETPWKFEVKGSKRSQSEGYTFLNVKEHRYVPYIMSGSSEYAQSAVVKGKWTKSARLYAKREGLKINFRKNPDGT